MPLTDQQVRWLDQALKAAGAAASPPWTITGVSSSGIVSPREMQARAQPVIDAFDPDDPAHATADLDAQVKAALDTERVFSAIVWVILDTYSAPAAKAKYDAARTKIIAAYKSQPWK